MSTIKSKGSVACAVNPVSNELYVFYYDPEKNRLAMSRTPYTKDDTEYTSSGPITLHSGWQSEIDFPSNYPAAPLAACYWVTNIYCFYVDNSGTIQCIISDGKQTDWGGPITGTKISHGSSLTALGDPYCRVIYTDESGKLMEARWSKATSRFQIEQLQT